MPQQTDHATAVNVANQALQTAQLHALTERRDMISEQYQTVMAERGRVGQERLNAQARGDAGMVKEYDATIERLGTRLKTLEQSLQAADQQIDRLMTAPVAIGEGGAAGEAITLLPPFDPMFDRLSAQRAEYQRAMAIEAGALLLFGALLWRFGIARGKRLVMREQRATVDTGRDDRLQVAVDAIAIEVERLSEGQRFLSNLLANRAERDALSVPPRNQASNSESMRVTPH